MVKKAWARTIAMIGVGTLVGAGLVLATPASGEIRSAVSAWAQAKPRLDKRYVKIVDRSKIVRTASRSTGVGTAISGATTIAPLTATIKAPGKGFLVVSSTGTYTASGTPLIHCGIGLDGDMDTWDDAFSTSAASSPSGTFETCDMSLRLKVGKGTHTVSYLAHNDSAGTLTYSGGSLTVTYVPFGRTGKVAAGRPIAPRGAGGDVVQRSLR